MEAILFSYETIRSDMGPRAYDEILDFLDELKKDFPELERAQISYNPENIKGYILVDLRDAIKSMDEAKLKVFTEKFLEAVRKAYDEGRLLAVSKARIIHKLCETSIEKIVECAKFFAPLITGTWKIEIRTRKIFDRMEVIRKVAEIIKQKVDLKNPQFVLHIEILGKNLTVMYLTRSGEEEKVIIRF